MAILEGNMAISVLQHILPKASHQQVDQSNSKINAKIGDRIPDDNAHLDKQAKTTFALHRHSNKNISSND